jgi:hypothetical protein
MGGIKPMKLPKITLLIFFLFMSISPYPKAEIATPETGKRIIVHKVGKGEELHLLAGYYLLNARDWGKIYVWNSDVINNQNRIYPGQELIVYVDENWQPPYDLDEYLRSIGRR